MFQIHNFVFMVNISVQIYSDIQCDYMCCVYHQTAKRLIASKEKSLEHIYILPESGRGVDGDTENARNVGNWFEPCGCASQQMLMHC